MQQLHTMRLLRRCKRGCIVYRKGNNGNNSDTMLSVRHELRKNDITAHALIQLQNLMDRLDYVPLSEENLKHGRCNKKVVEIIDEPTHINIKDLITVYKWQPCLCSIATFLPLFTEVIDKDMVKIEDVPKFDSLMYRIMGEQ